MGLFELAKARFTSAMEIVVLAPPEWASPPRGKLDKRLKALSAPIRYRAERVLGWSDRLTPPSRLRCAVAVYPDPRTHRAAGNSISQHFIDN